MRLVSFQVLFLRTVLLFDNRLKLGWISSVEALSLHWLQHARQAVASASIHQGYCNWDTKYRTFFKGLPWSMHSECLWAFWLENGVYMAAYLTRSFMTAVINECVRTVYRWSFDLQAILWCVSLELVVGSCTTWCAVYTCQLVVLNWTHCCSCSMCCQVHTGRMLYPCRVGTAFITHMVAIRQLRLKKQKAVYILIHGHSRQEQSESGSSTALESSSAKGRLAAESAFYATSWHICHTRSCSSCSQCFAYQL